MDMLFSLTSLAGFSLTVCFCIFSYKVWHWLNYRSNAQSKQKLKLFYSGVEIMGTTSDQRRAFMLTSNRITGIACLVLMLFLILLIARLAWINE